MSMSFSPEQHQVTIKFSTESEKIQVMTILEALQIFSTKNAEYDDGWKCYGTYGATFFIKDRANRIWRAVKSYQAFKREDALDLINLCCFAIRSQTSGNFGGEYWEESEVDMEGAAKKKLSEALSIVNSSQTDTEKVIGIAALFTRT